MGLYRLNFMVKEVCKIANINFGKRVFLWSTPSFPLLFLR